MTDLYLGNMNYSSWSIRAVLVARMSGLNVTERVLPLATEATRAYLLERTGFRQVPVLVEDDLVVSDSLAITEYIAERSAPGRVWPLDPKARARARSVTAEMHSSFGALRRECWVDIRSRRTDTVLSDAARGDVERVKAIWTACLSGKPDGGQFLFGAWSAVDAFYAPVVTRFRTYGIALDGTLADYATRVLAHPDMLAIEAAAFAEPWVMEPGPSGMVAVT